jgi:hypothetical protein
MAGKRGKQIVHCRGILSMRRRPWAWDGGEMNGRLVARPAVFEPVFLVVRRVRKKVKVVSLGLPCLLPPCAGAAAAPPVLVLGVDCEGCEVLSMGGIRQEGVATELQSDTTIKQALHGQASQIQKYKRKIGARAAPQCLSYMRICVYTYTHTHMYIHTYIQILAIATTACALSFSISTLHISMDEKSHSLSLTASGSVSSSLS